MEKGKGMEHAYYFPKCATIIKYFVDRAGIKENHSTQFSGTVGRISVETGMLRLLHPKRIGSYKSGSTFVYMQYNDTEFERMQMLIFKKLDNKG